MGFIGTWWNVLRHPSATMAEEKKNSSYGKAILHLVLPLAIIFALVAVVGFTVFAMLKPLLGQYGAMLGPMFGAAGLAILVVIFIAVAIILIITSFLSNVLYLAAAKVFGGTGEYKTQFYLLSLATAASFVGFIMLMVVAVLFMLVSPMLMLLWVLLFIAFGLYTIYLDLVALREAHAVSTAKALGIFIIASIAAWIISFMLNFSALTGGFLPKTPPVSP